MEFSGVVISTRPLSRGGLRRELGPTDSFTWLTRAASVVSTDPTLFPLRDVRTEAGSIHRVNPLTYITSLLQFEQLAVHNLQNSPVPFWSLLTGPQPASPRISL